MANEMSEVTLGTCIFVRHPHVEQPLCINFTPIQPEPTALPVSGQAQSSVEWAQEQQIESLMARVEDLYKRVIQSYIDGFEACREQAMHIVDEHVGYSDRIESLRSSPLAALPDSKPTQEEKRNA